MRLMPVRSTSHMTTAEAAAYCMVHPVTICRAASRGQLAARKKNRQWIITREACDEWRNKYHARKRKPATHPWKMRSQ